MNALDMVEKQQLRTDLPDFKPGDTIKVHVKIKEGDKERIQVFEGICIAQKHGGVRATFTVRKMSFGHGVERIFPLHSKIIDKVEVVRAGRRLGENAVLQLLVLALHCLQLVLEFLNFRYCRRLIV